MLKSTTINCFRVIYRRRIVSNYDNYSIHFLREQFFHFVRTYRFTRSAALLIVCNHCLTKFVFASCKNSLARMDIIHKSTFCSVTAIIESYTQLWTMGDARCVSNRYFIS